MSKEHRYRLGVDIGGTFTDFTLVDVQSKTMTSLKVPTVPHSPELGVRRGLEVWENEQGLDLSEVQYFVHGMTIGLNTLLQRAGSACALLVTKGFRDILNLQRARLPLPYDFNSFLPEPLVPRRFVYGIPERFNAQGGEVLPLDLAAVDRAVEDAVSQGIEAVAVAFLHSYRTPDHERQAVERIRATHPELKVCGSSEIWPEMREYERTSAAVSNLYIQRNVETYFANLKDILGAKGLETAPFITQSNGGVMNVGSAAAAPIKTLFSGPAAGVIGAVREATRAGRRDLLTFDMGGTSTDISVVIDGAPTYSNQSTVSGIPIVLPALDIATIGAGGGSIAWVDPSGLLKVGPESAGSNPGPACYGRGFLPTMTDAFMLCGYLSPQRFGGGRMGLDPARSAAAIGAVAEKLGKPTLDVADDMVRVSVSALYAEISNNMEQRGYDPRELTVVAYGGGGPVAANIVAEEIHARDVFVPYRPGTLCAMGALSADFTYDAVSAEQITLESGAEALVRSKLRELEEEARAWLVNQDTDAVDLERATVCCFADARYFGQSYEIPVRVTDADGRVLDVAGIVRAFVALHRRLYGHAEEESAIEIVSLRARITAPTPALPSFVPPSRPDMPGKPLETRAFRYNGAVHAAPIFNREDLCSEDRIPGPAVIEQDDTTVVVIPGWAARVDESLNILIEREKEED